MSWYLNLLFRLKIQSLIDHTWAKRGVSVCFHYLKVNTCNVYALYVVIVLVLNPFHTIFSLCLIHLISSQFFLTVIQRPCQL